MKPGTIGGTIIGCCFQSRGQFLIKFTLRDLELEVVIALLLAVKPVLERGIDPGLFRVVLLALAIEAFRGLLELVAEALQGFADRA